jgi:hypothetical protein
MRNTLADPTVIADSVPFWLGEGWTTRRRANSGGAGGSGDGGDDTGGDDGMEGSDGDGDDDGEGEGTDDGDAGDGDTVDKAEYEKLKARMSAADKAKSAAEKKLKDIEDAKKSDLEKAQGKVEDLTKERDAERLITSKLRMENAFLKVQGTTWTKPAAALKLAAAEGYFDEVAGDDGVIDQKKFAKKVAEFAKAYPELVKEQDDSSNGGSGSNGTGSTGEGVGSGRGAGKGGGKTGPTDEELRKRYKNILR